MTRNIINFSLYLLVIILFLGRMTSCKKTKNKGSRSYDNIPLSEKEMFGSRSLRCLVCRAVVEEFDYAISKVDPRKKIETGSARLAADGRREAKVVTYARSEIHLTELVDSICKEFEDYVQAKEKDTGEPIIIRLMDRKGGMNPRFGDIDIVPDEDLNTRLKFYCEGIVEDHEEELMELFAKEQTGVTRELCLARTAICSERNIGRDEL